MQIASFRLNPTRANAPAPAPRFGSREEIQANVEDLFKRVRIAEDGTPNKEDVKAAQNDLHRERAGAEHSRASTEHADALPPEGTTESRRHPALRKSVSLDEGLSRNYKLSSGVGFKHAPTQNPKALKKEYPGKRSGIGKFLSMNDSKALRKAYQSSSPEKKEAFEHFLSMKEFVSLWSNWKEYVVPADAESRHFPITMDGKTTGMVTANLKKPDADGWQESSLDYWMGGAHQNKGGMSQILPQILKHLVSRDGVKAVYFDINEENKPSLRLMKKLGIPLFKEKHFNPTHHVIDSYVPTFIKRFLITKEELEAEKTSRGHYVV